MGHAVPPGAQVPACWGQTPCQGRRRKRASTVHANCQAAPTHSFAKLYQTARCLDRNSVEAHQRLDNRGLFRRPGGPHQPLGPQAAGERGCWRRRPGEVGKTVRRSAGGALRGRRAPACWGRALGTQKLGAGGAEPGGGLHVMLELGPPPPQAGRTALGKLGGLCGLLPARGTFFSAARELRGWEFCFPVSGRGGRAVSVTGRRVGGGGGVGWTQPVMDAARVSWGRVALYV